MKIFNSTAIFILFLLGCSHVKAVDIPDTILLRSYGIQSDYVDTVYQKNVSEEDPNGILKILQKLEANAKDNGDIQLSAILRLKYLTVLNDRGLASDSLKKNLLKLISEADENNLVYLKTEAINLLADCYWDSKNYSLAFENYVNAYSIYSQFSAEEFPHKSDCIQDYGGKFYYFRDFNTAKNIFLDIWKTIPPKRIDNKTTKLNTLGLCYNYLQQYDSAEYYFHKAETYAISEHDSTWVGIISGNLGTCLFMQKRYDEAIVFLERKIKLSDKQNELIDLAFAYSTMGDIYLIKNENKKALDILLEAYSIVGKKSLFKRYDVTSRIYLPLSKAYAANGKIDLAFSYLDSARVAIDSTEHQRNILYISGVQQKIEVEKHKNEMLKKEAELNQQKFFINSLMGCVLTVLLFTIVILRQKKKISAAKKRSDELLLNILPVETAEELKNYGRTDAKNFSEVTIMFTDFKNFTQSAENMTAVELVKELDYCFKKFDEITSGHNIEKIKTIGDSYMCAAGLPTENKTHAVDTLKAAIKIRDFIAAEKELRVKEGKPFFEIRIGLHTGPVVAGIVGIKKFSYDIWGDTVNIAARMESSGEVGKVNISEATYQIVKDKFKCIHRGKIEAKNKGEIDMYFVENSIEKISA